MNYIEQIKQLRQQIPVGVKAAEKYLEATNGSTEEAGSLYKTEMKNLFITKTGVTPEESEKYFPLYLYNFGKAIDMYERDKYNHVEYIVHHTKEKESTLDTLLPHINDTLQTHNALADYPESYFAYKSLHEVMEWINYYEWEGYLNPNYEVLCFLKNVLGLPLFTEELSKLWDKMKIRIEELKKDNKSAVDIIMDSRRQELSRKENDLFQANREKIIEGLYEYVIKNIHLFSF